MKQTPSLILILTLCAMAAAQAQTISLETAPPVVVKTIPEAGTKDVDPSITEIRVKFSKDMKDGTWSWSTWGEDTFPETTGKPRYLDDGRTCVLPVKLEPGRFYATWLNSGKFGNFKDAEGRSAVPYLLSFETGQVRAADVNEKAMAADVDFVRVVLDATSMTLEGEPTNWEELEKRLAELPGRDRTVLEFAVPSTDVTLQDHAEWSARFARLAHEFGFLYSSYVGVHPFGSKGGTPPSVNVLSSRKRPGMIVFTGFASGTVAVQPGQELTLVQSINSLKGFQRSWADLNRITVTRVDQENGMRKRKYTTTTRSSKIPAWIPCFRMVIMSRSRRRLFNLFETEVWH